jgi:hypothetical protein
MSDRILSMYFVLMFLEKAFMAASTSVALDIILEDMESIVSSGCCLRRDWVDWRNASWSFVAELFRMLLERWSHAVIGFVAVVAAADLVPVAADGFAGFDADGNDDDDTVADFGFADDEEEDFTPLCLASCFHFLISVLAFNATSAFELALNLDTVAPINVSANMVRLMEHLSRCEMISRICSLEDSFFPSLFS